MSRLTNQAQEAEDDGLPADGESSELEVFTLEVLAALPAKALIFWVLIISTLSAGWVALGQLFDAFVRQGARAAAHRQREVVNKSTSGFACSSVHRGYGGWLRPLERMPLMCVDYSCVAHAMCRTPRRGQYTVYS